MTKFVLTIAILLAGLVAFARGQQTSSDRLSDADKTAIIESVLTLESRNRSSVSLLPRMRTAVSSQNIQFIEPSRLSDHGFALLTAAELSAAKRDHVIEYWLFKQILWRDGVAVVYLSRVSEGRGCFGTAPSTELKYTYKARPTVVGWIAELTQGPPSPVSFSAKRLVRR